MRTKLAILALGLALNLAAHAETFSAAQLQQRAIERRAVEAAIWGMPLVNVDAMRQPYFAAGAKYNDCIYWSNPNTWMNQTTTPNHSTSYVMFFMNLKDGPVVVDIPRATEQALYGTLITCWNEPHLRVPANVPTSQFWAADVYDATTGAFFRETPVVGLDSYKQSLKQNADGTTDVYFGPKAPAGKESNWIPTPAGKPYFVMFRIYGPQKGAVDGSWILNDIEEVK